MANRENGATARPLVEPRHLPWGVGVIFGLEVLVSWGAELIARKQENTSGERGIKRDAHNVPLVESEI